MRLSVLILILGLGFSATAQTPTADEVVNKYLETIGGVDAWKSINNMVLEGNSVQMGMTFPTKVVSARPNLFRLDVDVMGKQIIDAYDGTVAWGVNPFMGGTTPQPKTEEETKEMAKRMFENDFIDYQAKGFAVSLDGTEEIEGVPTYKIKLTKQDGEEEYHFIDTENYVTIMTRTFIQSGQAKGTAIETYLSDYQEVEGKWVPFTMEQRANGQTILTTTATAVRFDVPDLDAAMFSLPK